MRADLSVITATPGQIDGEIVISYEDALEEKMEERLPLSILSTKALTPMPTAAWRTRATLTSPP